MNKTLRESLELAKAAHDKGLESFEANPWVWVYEFRKVAK